jgi:hypothetical protein
MGNPKKIKVNTKVSLVKIGVLKDIRNITGIPVYNICKFDFYFVQLSIIIAFSWQSHCQAQSSHPSLGWRNTRENN